MYMHDVCWLLELAEYKKDGWYFGYVSSVPEKRQRKRQSIHRRSDHIVAQTQVLKNKKCAQAQQIAP